jgi:hypothetical protein
MLRVFVLALSLSFLSGSVSPVFAQEASPAASPAAECLPWPSLGGTPVPIGSLPTVTTEAEPATPAASPGPVGTAADPATIDRVLAAERNLEACVNAGAYDLVIAMHLPEALPALFGTEDPAAAATMLEGFPPLRTLALEHVQILPDGRLSVESTFTVGGERMHWRDYWVERNGVLYYAGYEVLPLADATPSP